MRAVWSCPIEEMFVEDVEDEKKVGVFVEISVDEDVENEKKRLSRKGMPQFLDSDPVEIVRADGDEGIHEQEAAVPRLKNGLRQV